MIDLKLQLLGDEKIEDKKSDRNSEIVDIMPDFRSKTNVIYTIMNMIKSNNEQIDQLKNEEIQTTSSEIEKQINKKIQNYTQINLELTKKIENKVRELDIEIQVSKENSPDEPETLAKVNVQNSLKYEIQKLVQQQQIIHSGYRNAVKEKLERQFKLIDPDITQDKRDKLIEDPDGLQKLIQSKQLGNHSLQLEYKVEDIKEKATEIQRLENTHQSCQQMLRQIGQLVHAQGEKIDSIEENLITCKDYVEKAEKELKERKEEQKAIRNRMCCILFLGLGIIFVICLPFLIKIVRDKASS